MVWACCAVSCSNRYGMPGKRFYSFPKDEELRDRWTAAVSRKDWNPTKYTKICSDHFITGKPSRGPLHPDLVPSIFSFKKTVEKLSSRYQRAVRRSRSQANAAANKPRTSKRQLLRECQEEIINTAPARVNGGIAEPSEFEMADDEEAGCSEQVNSVDNASPEKTANENEIQSVGEVELEGTADECNWLGIEDEQLENVEGNVSVGSDEMSVTDEEWVVVDEVTDDEIECNQSDRRSSSETDDEWEPVDSRIDCLPELGEVADMSDYSREMLAGDEVDMADYVASLIHQLEQKEIEIGVLQMENEKLRIENEKLEQQNMELRGQIFLGNASQPLVCAHQDSASGLENDDKKVCFYTGLPTYDVFNGLCSLLQPLVTKDGGKCCLSVPDEILLVLMKLRLDLPNEDLGYRFRLAPKTVSTVFQKWISIMSIELKCLVCWPDSFTLRENLPSCFKKHFSKVKCVIDCFEVFIERPTAFEARATTYSNYKKHNTVKALIGIAPTGCISFISQAWGGRVSDKEITQRCGFLDKVEYGDDIMADRGFTIADELAVCGSRLLIPAFTRGKQQLSQREVEKTRQLARVRIHVERVIGQMRKKYKILSNTLPISLLKCPSDADRINCTIDRILIVAAALTNMSNSVVPQ